MVELEEGRKKAGVGDMEKPEEKKEHLSLVLLLQQPDLLFRLLQHPVGLCLTERERERYFAKPFGINPSLSSAILTHLFNPASPEHAFTNSSSPWQKRRQQKEAPLPDGVL